MTLQARRARKRGGRRRRSRADRERQIVRAATGMFAERGYLQTTMDQVAERCGISKPLVYEYFGSKDGLFLATVEQAQAELCAAVRGSLEGNGAQGDPLFRAMLCYFEFMEARPHFLAALVHDSRLPPPAPPRAIDSVRHAQQDMIRPVLRTAAPGLSPQTLAMYAEIVLGGCERLASRRLAHPDMSAAATAEHMTSFIRFGLDALVGSARVRGGATCPG